jgi:hypothetical protein
VAVLPQDVEGRVNPVAFKDADGNFVPPALPNTWARTAVTDATVPCPACGITDWEEVQPNEQQPHSEFPDLPGDPDYWVENPFPRCRRCGHEEPGGTWLTASPDTVEPEALEALQRRAQEDRRDSSRAALDQIKFPLLRVVGAPARLSGWGGGAAGFTNASLTVGDPSSPWGFIKIETEAWRADLDAAIEALPTPYGVGEAEEWPEISRPALSIWLEGQRREERLIRLNALKGVVPKSIVVDVDSEPHGLTVVETGKCWAISGRVRDMQVTISGDEGMPKGLALETVTDTASLA